MRNVRVFSGYGRVLDAGLVRLAPGVNLIQEDNLTAQFLQQYGEDIAVISLDGLIEKCGSRVNKAYLVRTYGWTAPEEPAKPVVTAKAPEAKPVLRPEPELASEPEMESETEETLEAVDNLQPPLYVDFNKDSKKRKKK